MPESALDDLCALLSENPCHLRITAPRSTKYGDFRPAGKGLHHISVNGDLNPFAFTITLVHEIAHLRVWDQFGRKVKPHGQEWKSEFSALLSPLYTKGVFPEDVSDALEQYLANPKASSCTDLDLMRALNVHNEDPGFELENLKEGDHFIYKGREYIRGKKRRTRIVCTACFGRREFLFHALTPVEPVENPQATV